MDALYTRLGNDEAAIAAVASQLPQQQRDILTAIRTAQQAAQAQPQVMFEKSMPHQLKLDSVPAAADAPAEEKP